MSDAQHDPSSDEIYRIVRALRENALPRNRYFELHATPVVRAARRVHRFLRALERDLRVASEVRVDVRPGGGVRLELRHASLRIRRTVDLDAYAHALLLENEEARTALGRASS